MGNGSYLVLNTSAIPTASATAWNNTTPTSSVFSIGTGAPVNSSSSNLIALCWTAIPGYSAFGSYTGNASANGPFTYLGFKPRYLLIKRTDATGDWYIIDSSRSPVDVVAASLFTDTTGAESSSTVLDILSNGFKCRSSTVVNASAGTYIYAAFAENPFTITRAV